MIEGTRGPFENDHNKEILEGTFEKVVIAIPVFGFTDNGERTLIRTDQYLGYKLNPGIDITGKTVDIMRRYGYEPAVLWCKTNKGHICLIPLQNNAIAHIKATNGLSVNAGSINMDKLFIQIREQGIINEKDLPTLGLPFGETIFTADTKKGKQKKDIGMITEAVIQSTIPATSALSDLSRTTIVQDYETL